MFKFLCRLRIPGTGTILTSRNFRNTTQRLLPTMLSTSRGRISSKPLKSKTSSSLSGGQLKPWVKILHTLITIASSLPHAADVSTAVNAKDPSIKKYTDISHLDRKSISPYASLVLKHIAPPYRESQCGQTSRCLRPRLRRSLYWMVPRKPLEVTLSAGIPLVH